MAQGEGEQISQQAAVAGAGGTALTALAGLAGYIPGLGFLGSIRTDYIPMAPSTATCFLLLAAAVFWRARQRALPHGARAMAAAVSLVTLFALLESVQPWVGIELEAWLHPAVGTLGAIPVGRMSPVTGAVFVAAGLSAFLLLAARNPRGAPQPGHWAAGLGVATLLSGMTVLLAYLYGTPLMYRGPNVPMAATTAIGFVFLGAALVAGAGPASYPLRLVVGDATAARLSRVFLPLTIAAVLLEGALARFVSAASLGNEAVVLALVVVLVALATVMAVARVAHALGGSLDEANRKLQESEQALRESQRIAHLGGWRVDLASGQLSWTAEVFHIHELPLGAPPTLEQAIGYYLPAARKAIEQAVRDAIEQGKPFDLELQIQTACGQIRWVHVRGAARHAAELPSVVSGTLQDITAYKQAEAEIKSLNADLEERVRARTADLELANQALVLAKSQAEAANVAKSAFLANISHEIRTPLNAITGMAYLMRDAGMNPAQCERLDRIETASQHLLEIVNAIIDLSKIEAGKLALEETAVHVDALLGDVAAVLRARTAAKQLQIVVAADVPTGRLIGDPTRVQQALLHYASNAVKFTETGRIVLRVLVAEETADSVLLRFEVQDTGIGIAADALPRLFRSFEQADNTTTRKYGGTGLGLAITRKLAELMGGTAGAESELGVGSTFWFTARLRKDPLAPTAAD